MNNNNKDNNNNFNHHNSNDDVGGQCSDGDDNTHNRGNSISNNTTSSLKKRQKFVAEEIYYSKEPTTATTLAEEQPNINNNTNEDHESYHNNGSFTTKDVSSASLLDDDDDNNNNSNKSNSNQRFQQKFPADATKAVAKEKKTSLRDNDNNNHNHNNNNNDDVDDIDDADDDDDDDDNSDDNDDNADIQLLSSENGGEDSESVNSSEERKRKLEFLEYCNLLQSNSPHVCKVEITVKRVPVGCLQQIGDAIVQNTHIKELVLFIEAIYNEDNNNDDTDIDNLQHVSSLIEFIRTSITLRKVCIYDKFYYLWEESDCVKERWPDLIFDAISVNKSIQELHIGRYCTSDGLHRLMSTSTSLRTLHLDCCAVDPDDMDRRDRFLSALASNRSIDNLSLTIGKYGWEWVEEIPVRIGNGPSTLQCLTILDCRMYPQHFCNLIATTKSLETLEFLGCFWDESSPLENEALLQSAFAANTSIVHLKIYGAFHDDTKDYDGVLINKILGCLHNGPATLRQLSLISMHHDWVILQQYLCTSSAARLQQLELEDCQLDANCLDCLVEGFRVLDSSNPSATTTMTHLKLNTCYLNEYDILPFIDFVTARTQCHWHHWADMTVLKSFHNCDCANMAYPPPKFPDQLDGTGDFIEVSMSSTELLPPSDGGASTSFAVATLLSMRSEGNVPAFSSALLATAGMSSLVSLQLCKIGPRDSEKIALWLYSTTSLRALHLVDIQDDVIPATILNGLKHNGSLLTATFVKADSQPFFQDVHHNRMIQSCWQRNQFLLEMILNKMTLWNIPFLDLEIVLENATNHNTMDNDAHRDRRALLPTLFRAANYIPLTRPRFLIAALSTLDLAIEQRG